jgi:hypothetical protein
MRNLLNEIENNIISYGYNINNDDMRELNINELSERMGIDFFSLRVICEEIYFVNSDNDNAFVSCYID